MANITNDQQVYVCRCFCGGIVSTFRSDPARFVKPPYRLERMQASSAKTARWCTDRAHSPALEGVSK